MSSQLGLQFGSESAALRVETANLEHCIRCGAPREGSKPGSVCGGKCRIERSMARRKLEAEGYLADRPPPVEPAARRNRGKAIAAANHREDLETARRLALAMLAERSTGTISDLREYAAKRGVELPWSLPWVANVFLGAEPRWFEPTGDRRASTHVRGNARKVNVYRLSAAGRERIKGMTE